MNTRHTKRIDRRTLLKAAVGGTAAFAVGRVAFKGLFDKVLYSQPGPAVLNLVARDAFVEMVDLRPVYHWLWQMEGDDGPRLPGPVIIATEGTELTVNVRNALGEEHSFGIRESGEPLPDPLGQPFVPGPGMIADTGPVTAGGTGSTTFIVPRAGTYLYEDVLNAPLNRIMGLHGMLISLPPAGNTPYSNPPASIQQLFDDLGTVDFLPGHPWKETRTWIWVIESVDPAVNAAVQAGQRLDGQAVVRDSIPRYWMMTGKSGFFSGHDPRVRPTGFAGNPALIRCIDAGITTASIHTHGTHCWETARNQQPLENVIRFDTFTIQPGQAVDVVIPFVEPVDIPRAAYPPRQETVEMVYAVHDHIEMSNTADGGNYIQGMATDIVILGPVGPESGGPDEIAAEEARDLLGPAVDPAAASHHPAAHPHHPHRMAPKSMLRVVRPKPTLAMKR